MSKEVESIKAKKETREKLAKIRNKSEWLEKEANKTFALMDISVKDLDSKPERWITIPLTELEALYEELHNPKLHSKVIFNRLAKVNKLDKKTHDFANCFCQIETFFEMNNLQLDKRRDGVTWIITAGHDLGRNFSIFFSELICLIVDIDETMILRGEPQIFDNTVIFELSKNGIPFSL